MQNGVVEKDIVLPVPAVNTLALSYYYCLIKGRLDGHEPSPLFNRLEFVSSTWGGV